MASHDSNVPQSRGLEASDAEVAGAPQPSQHIHHDLLRTISGIDEVDAASKYRIGKDGKQSGSPNSSSSSIRSPSRGKQIIRWDDGDPENPNNWSSVRKAYVVFIGVIIVMNSTMGSSLPSNAIPVISSYFDITSSYAQTLPISMYLVGYILGPLLFGPLSETWGRKWMLLWSFAAFTILTMACAVAPNYGSLLFFRLAAGISASSPIAIVAGTYADMYADPVPRGRALAIYISGTCIGPLVAPLLSGFVSTELGWRWVFWVGLMVAGATWPFIIFLPETYSPTLLTRRARKMRALPDHPQIFAAIELEEKSWRQLMTVTLTRPLRMLFFELLVLTTCLYLSLAYGIFYMYFQTYSIVFEGIYHQSPGVSGLMFLPIGAGVVLAAIVFLWYDSFLRKAQAQGKPWTKREESRRLPLAFLGGPAYVIALLWLGWTAREDVSFVVPMLAGIPFGLGFILIFMALLNYLTDAYEVFAASSMAATSFCRSIAGAVLPFATKPMYNRLGVNWASSLLGFLSLLMCFIPFLFLWKGDRIRAGSKFCTYLKEQKEKEAEETRILRERKQANEAVVGSDEPKKSEGIV